MTPSDVSVEPTFAERLKAPASYVAATVASDAWGAAAVESEIISPLALRDDAAQEASRQLAMLQGPLALDEHIVPGKLSSLVGHTVIIRGDRLGYDLPARVFVLEAQEQADGTTVLSVLKGL
jgi:hypothetical protein